MNTRLLPSLLAVCLQCLAVDQAVAQRPSSPIRVGALLPLTGDYAQYGQELLRGVQLGADSESAQIIAEDSGTMNTGSSLSAASRLVDIEKVDALLVLGSDDVQPLVGLGARTAVPILSLWDNSASLSKMGDFVFSNGFSLEGTANLYATFGTKKLGARKAAIIGNQSAWSSTIADEFVKQFEQQGGAVVFQDAVPDDFSDFRSIVLKLSQKKPDIIFLPLSLPATALQSIKQLRAAKVEVPIFATETFVGNTMTSLGPQADGVFVGWIPQPAVSITDKYKRKFGVAPSDPGVVEVGYSGVRKVLEAHLKHPDMVLKAALREIFGASRRATRSYHLYRAQSGKLIPVG